MKLHLGQKFSTRDQDNDKDGRHCAELRKGAWWHNNCYHASLNGLYYQSGEHRDGVVWYLWTHKSLRFTEMKIRPFYASN